MNTRFRRSLALLGCLLVLAALQAPELWASSAGGPIMPWNGPLQRLLDNLSGPTAQTLGMLAFVIGALMWGFSRSEDHLRRFGGAVFGAAIAIGVVNLFNALAFQGAVL